MVQWMPTQVLGVPVPADRDAARLIPFPEGATDYPEAGDEPTVEAVRSVYVETREIAEQQIRSDGTDYKKLGMALHKGMQNRKLDSLRNELREYDAQMAMYQAPQTLRTKLATQNCADFLDTDVRWRQGPDVLDKSVIDELDRREFAGRHGNAGELKLAAQAVLETQTTVITHLKELRALDAARRAIDKYNDEAEEDIATANAIRAEANKLMTKFQTFHERGINKRQNATALTRKLNELRTAHAPTRAHLEKDAQERVWNMLYNGSATPNKRDATLCKTLELDPKASSPANVMVKHLFSGLADTVARNKFGKLLEAAATASADARGFVEELSPAAKAHLLEQLQASLATEGQESLQQLQERRPGAPWPHHSAGPLLEGEEEAEEVDGEVIEVVEADAESDDSEGEEAKGDVARAAVPALVPIATHLS